jgi:N-acylneuraminate cytidylyltransferase
MEYRARGSDFGIACCAYPCVPLLSGRTLAEAHRLFVASGLDALQPVLRYPSPPEWAMSIEGGLLVPDDREAQAIRSQDLRPRYFDAGMFYMARAEALLREGTMTPERTMAYVMDAREAQDIDTIEDWEEAEMKYELLRGRGRGDG